MLSPVRAKGAKEAGSWLRRGLWLCVLPLAACTTLAPEAPVRTAPPEDAIPAASLLPLSTAEFDAAVLESRRRNRHQREDAIDQPWDSLNTDQLRRMLHMPAFAALSDRMKEPLIDQAGAWNLLTFERPSEALALWAMLFPDRKIEQPIDPKIGTSLPHLHVYRADEPWAIESAATMVMVGCLSPPVWHVYAEDPMLWAMRSNTGWEVPNSFDFGMCVRKSTPTNGPGLWSNRPDTAYGRRIAAVLEDKFARLLLRQGCAGKGPDSCLHLMYALASLNPSHPQWPAILDKTAPAFVPENLPPSGTTDRTTLMAARTAIARQNIYLGIRLQVLGHSAATWHQDGMDGMGLLRATIDQILSQALAQQTLESVYLGQTNLDVVGASFQPADPWNSFRSNSELPPALQRALEDWVRDHTPAPHCALPARLFQWVPPQMALAWWVERMAQGRDTCEALPKQWIAQHYARGETAPIAPLRPYLRPSQVRQNAWICTRWTDFTRPPPQDPWALCKPLLPPKTKTRPG